MAQSASRIKSGRLECLWENFKENLAKNCRSPIAVHRSPRAERGGSPRAERGGSPRAKRGGSPRVGRRASPWRVKVSWIVGLRSSDRWIEIVGSDRRIGSSDRDPRIEIVGLRSSDWDCRIVGSRSSDCWIGGSRVRSKVGSSDRQTVRLFNLFNSSRRHRDIVEIVIIFGQNSS